MNCIDKENFNMCTWLEKRVLVKDKCIGTLKYFGTTKFSDGLWCGIELDEPVGKNNGTVNNIEYFKCLPKFGIFVPVNKVQKIEDSAKNLSGASVYFNETFEVRNCREKTIILSNSPNLSYNCNKEKEIINEVNKMEEAKIRHDSEESLGLLDPKLIESLTNSLDSFSLDAAGDIVPNIRGSILKLDNQESGFSVPYMPVSSSLFSNEMINPKYASTPRHPVKKKFSEFSDVRMDLALPDVDELTDVFENETNFPQDITFDTEKLKNNPNLTSTSEYHQVINASSGVNVNVFSPVNSIDLNKTQIISLPFTTNKEIIPVLMDFNKTMTFSNGSEESVPDAEALSKTFKSPTEMEAPETKVLNPYVNPKTQEVLENCLSQVRTPFDTVFETDCSKTKDFNSTINSKNRKGSERCQKAFQVIYPADSMIENGCLEYKDFNSDISFENRAKPKAKENGQISYMAGTLADIPSFANINLNSTCDFGIKFIDNSVKNVSKLDMCKPTHISLSKTFNNNSSSSVVSIEDGDKSPFQKTFVLESSPSEENRNDKQAMPLKVVDNLIQLESFNYKNKFLEETSSLKSSIPGTNLRKSTCIPGKSRSSLNCPQRFSCNSALNSTFPKKSKEASNVSGSFKNLKSQLKIGDTVRKEVEFKKPLSMHSSIGKLKAPIKNVTSTISKKKSSSLKESVLELSDKTFVSEANPKDCDSVLNTNLGQHVEENKNFNCVENESALPGESLVSNSKVNSKIGVKSINARFKKGRLSASYHLVNKFNGQEKERVKQRYSHVFSYSQNAESNEQLNTSGILHFVGKSNKDFKNSNKIKCLTSPITSPGNDLNLDDTPKVPLNKEKNLFAKKLVKTSSDGSVKNPLVSQLKEPAKRNKLPISYTSLGLSSNGHGIARRNSLAGSSKLNLPVGIVKPRYSMLPLIKGRNLGEAKNGGHIEEHHTRSNDGLVPEAVLLVGDYAKSQSSKMPRVSTLIRKSLVATRIVGEKYSDVKDENYACPKIPRYNLRGKK